jgi:hypothetical protein
MWRIIVVILVLMFSCSKARSGQLGQEVGPEPCNSSWMIEILKRAVKSDDDPTEIKEVFLAPMEDPRTKLILQLAGRKILQSAGTRDPDVLYCMGVIKMIGRDPTGMVEGPNHRLVFWSAQWRNPAAHEVKLQALDSFRCKGLRDNPSDRLWGSSDHPVVFPDQEILSMSSNFYYLLPMKSTSTTCR